MVTPRKSRLVGVGLVKLADILGCFEVPEVYDSICRTCEYLVLIGSCRVPDDVEKTVS